MKRRAGMVLMAGLAVTLASCREVSGPQPTYHYLMTLGLATNNATGLNQTCRYGASMAMDSIPGAAWSRAATGGSSRVLRQVYGSTLTGMVSAEQDVGTLQFSATYPFPDSIEIVVSGPIADTLRGHLAFGAWSGTWRCPASVPLASDPALIASGYNASVPMLGTWSLSPASPID